MQRFRALQMNRKRIQKTGATCQDPNNKWNLRKNKFIHFIKATCSSAWCHVKLYIYIFLFAGIVTFVLLYWIQTAYDVSRPHQAGLQIFPDYSRNLELWSTNQAKAREPEKPTQGQESCLFHFQFHALPIGRGPAAMPPTKHFKLSCLEETWQITPFCKAELKKYLYRPWSILNTRACFQQSKQRSFYLCISPCSHLLSCNKRVTRKCPNTLKEHLLFLSGRLMINSFN